MTHVTITRKLLFTLAAGNSMFTKWLAAHLLPSLVKKLITIGLRLFPGKLFHVAEAMFTK